MKASVACFLFVSLIPTCGFGQTGSPGAKRNQTKGTAVRRNAAGAATNPATANAPIRICQGVAIPTGYTIVGYETSTTCPHGAYVLKRDDAGSRFSVPPNAAPPQTATQGSPQATAAPAATVSRPRRVSSNDNSEPFSSSNGLPPQLTGANNNSAAARPPKLAPMPNGVAVSEPATESSGVSLDAKKDNEVGEGDVVRIETSLVSVPVSVLDRQGRFIGNLKREDFKIFENGVEQGVAYFEPTEKPFTVALVLDTSGSTVFRLDDIKAAAISFAKQLRPQDRVLVVTFDERVMLLTEATSDLNVVTQVIEENAFTGHSTRLYDALDLVINLRLNKISGRKAMVLFTDGVDTASYDATYESTLRQAEELDALIYPIQYDTTDFMAAQQNSSVTVVTRSGNWPFGGGTTSSRVYKIPNQNGPPTGSTAADYKLADKYLHQLAEKTGARLYKANDPAQLSIAFSKIAEELRSQYSLGYYPQTPPEGGERRAIKVRVPKPELAVRARESYVKKVSTN